jgi:hypothetical protein
VKSKSSSTIDWSQLVTSLAQDAEPSEAQDARSLSLTEMALGIELPEQLREFLSQYGSLTANYGTAVVWAPAEIASRNAEFRRTESFKELYMPFDNLLFFGEEGGGDQFAYAIHADGRIHKLDIYLWEHETDARSWFAGNLQQFLTNVLSAES